MVSENAMCMVHSLKLTAQQKHLKMEANYPKRKPDHLTPTIHFQVFSLAVSFRAGRYTTLPGGNREG